MPSYLIPPSEGRCQTTEVDKGLIRREALDLLGYSYAETDAGKFLISGDLDLVCKKPFRGGSAPLADSYTKRVKLKSLSSFHIRPSIGS